MGFDSLCKIGRSSVILLLPLFISWRLILLVEETGGPGEKHSPVASHGQTVLHNIIHLALIKIRTHNISSD
jgi:hypothetical protein